MSTATQTIRNNPFVRIVVPLIAGIVVGRALEVPVWLLVSGFVTVYVCAWLTLDRPQGVVYTVAVIFACSMMLGSVYKTNHELPYNQHVVVCVQVADTPQVSGRWQKTTAHVGYYQLQDSTQWHRVSQSIVLNLDTAYRIALGDQFACRGYVNSFDRGQDSLARSDYAALMDARGFSGTMYVSDYNVVVASPVSSRTPQYYAKKFQHWAVERLERLRLTDDQRAIVVTMSAGEKRGMSKELRDDYARVGASHLLAVSGLHVGIVMILLNLLLLPLMFVWRGHIARNVIVIVAIWAYAVMAGLSPSVVRSAMMLSGAQLAFATTSHRDSLNILLGTAVVMLCLNPNNLYDISFQLSFVAVLFILLAYYPVYKMVRTRSKLLKMVVSVTVLGLVASAGTMPWVAYKFGNLPLIGIALNPLLILESTAIVLLGVGWIIAPVGFLNSTVSWCLGWVVDTQNAVVQWSAGLRWSAIEVNPSWWVVGVCYFLLLSVAVWLFVRADKPEPLKLKNDEF